MQRRTAISVAVGVLSIACASGPLREWRAEPEPPKIVLGPLPGGGEAIEVAGAVFLEKGGAPIDGALVILECACLEGSRETNTGEDGRFRFSRLPPGAYRVQVLYQKANESAKVTIRAGMRASIEFRIEPNVGPQIILG